MTECCPADTGSLPLCCRPGAVVPQPLFRITTGGTGELQPEPCVMLNAEATNTVEVEHTLSMPVSPFSALTLWMDPRWLGKRTGQWAA